MVKILREDTEGISIKKWPFEAVRQYLRVRVKYRTPTESFFVFTDRTLVLPHHFRAVLKSMIEKSGLDLTLYGTHSFRVGRSVDLFYKSNLSVSVSSIKMLGRWKSNIVYRYLAGV